MKKIFVLAALTMVMGAGIAFATEGGKDKKKEKAKTEKCTKPCTKPCPKPTCCDKSKCKKS